jgi:hypothetical protein
MDTSRVSQDTSQQQSASQTATDVCICVVSHNHDRFLEPLFRSLETHRPQAAIDVTLVDNVGQPEIVDLIENKFPWVNLIVNQRRMGFAENNNQVIVPSNARYSFLLNPDTEVQPGAVDRLVAFMDEHPDIGACGPKLIYPDGRLQLSCRRFPTLGSFLVRRTPLRLLLGKGETRRRYEMADWDHDSPRSIDWLFGAAILIRRETLQDVGGLDEGMFMYSEDVDWCLRCRQKGWDIWYLPDSVILHHLDDRKYNRFFSRHRFMHYRSMARFVRKHWRYCLRP